MLFTTALLKIGEAVSKGNVEDGLNIAKRYTSNRMKYLKQKISRDMNPDQHSFEAVAIYKKELDKTDPFLIYKVNDGKMNNLPDFVFKSAKDMLLLAAEMDQSGGSHSRCVGFKTLGLFVLHPGMRCLLRLASMEVRTESTKNIAMF